MKLDTFNLYTMNNLNDGIYIVDEDMRIVFWNKAMEEITGYPANEITGRRSTIGMLSHIDMDGKPLSEDVCPLAATMAVGMPCKEKAFIRHREGHRIPVYVNILPLFEKGKSVGAVEVVTPKTPIVYQDDVVEHPTAIAMYDELTELPNRRYLQSFLEYRLSEYSRFDSIFAIMQMDFDNFNIFNKTYGQQVGDLVMKETTKSIQKTTRKMDMFGRWSGDMFLGIYLLKSADDAKIVAEKVRMLVAHTELPFDTPLSITATVGITIVRVEDTEDTILTRVNKMVAYGKKTGKNRIVTDESFI